MKKLEPEFAEDDRVIGIPHVMTTAGDKIYIINGRIMTGWSMYFSLTAIRSPENYSQIVDIVYNVPYVFAAVAFRASLSLGARFDVVDDPNTPTDDKMVAFVRELIYDRLKVDGNFLKKVSAHMDIYGNSYVHIRRNEDGIPNKLTILQPERMKVFLDPMTTKILFYIYLPPIIGGTVLVPYPYSGGSAGGNNPNLIANIALTYPTPIIVPPEDICHFKQYNWTEYPFGFSLLRSAMEPAQARLDYTIISPIIYKHYAKPLVHWMLDPTGLNPNQVKNHIGSLKDQLESMEPTSDLLTVNKWSSNVITGVSKGFSSAMDMIADADTQIFASMGVPETYFKARGTTDKMVSEQDKLFVKNMKDRQEYFAETFKDKIIYPAIRAHFGMDDDATPHVRLQWRKMVMTDDSVEIQNTIAMLQMGIIDMNEARRRLALPKSVQEQQADSIDNFVKQTTGQSTAQIPPTAGAQPMGAPAMAPVAAPVAQPPPLTPPDEMTLALQDQSEDDGKAFLLQRPNEADDAYIARINARYKPSAPAKKGQIEIADNAAVRIAGQVGKKDEWEYTGPKDVRERVSSKPCPFCAKAMFISQDEDDDEHYRCERHGNII